MTRKILEFRLDSLDIKNTVPLDGEEDVYLIICSLVYPREGVPAVMTMKNIGSHTIFPMDCASADYEKRIIFKEGIIGDTQLMIKVLAVNNLKKFEEFLSSVFKGLLKVTFGKLASGITNVVLASVAGTTQAEILRTIELNDDAKNLGATSISIIEGDFEGNSQINLDLHVPEAIVIEREVEANSDDNTMIDETLVEAGEYNGEITLECIVHTAV